MNERAPQAVAHLRFVRTAPRKLRRVADAIRGKSVREALVLLQFADVYAAEPIEKLVRSAVANAGNNHDMNADELYITRITVDGGPGGRFTKRLDPRAQGRACVQAQAPLARDGHRQRNAAEEAAQANCGRIGADRARDASRRRGSAAGKGRRKKRSTRKAAAAVAAPITPATPAAATEEA